MTELDRRPDASTERTAQVDLDLLHALVFGAEGALGLARRSRTWSWTGVGRTIW